jgi:hypothetical protein
VTEKLQSVEATTQQTLANLAAQPKIEESKVEEDEEEDQKVPGGLKNALDEINAKNLQLMSQITLQDQKLKAFSDAMSSVKALPILEFDENKLKTLVCDTFKENKRTLMKRGATQIKELMGKNLE